MVNGNTRGDVMFNNDTTNGWLTDVLCRKPASQAEANAARVKKSVLMRKMGAATAGTLPIYAAEYLYPMGAGHKLFDCRAEFLNTPRKQVFLAQYGGKLYIVDTQGYDYARYVGLVVVD